MSDTPKKEIEVVSGDGKNLNISPVYEHLPSVKPKSKDDKKKNIIIPETKYSKNKKTKE